MRFWLGISSPNKPPAELRSVAEVLVALQAPPDQREVAGWGEALTVYRQMAGRPGTPGRPRPRRRPGLFASLLRARVAAAAGAAAVAALGGGVAAAYTGSLPAALQKIAHEALAAPAARVAAPTAEGSGHPGGPSVTGAAAYGLCNAYQHAEAHGTASQRAVAFRNLVRAAGEPTRWRRTARWSRIPAPPPRPAAGSARPARRRIRGTAASRPPRQASRRSRRASRAPRRANQPLRRATGTATGTEAGTATAKAGTEANGNGNGK